MWSMHRYDSHAGFGLVASARVHSNASWAVLEPSKPHPSTRRVALCVLKPPGATATATEQPDSRRSGSAAGQHPFEARTSRGAEGDESGVGFFGERL
jgi:hypothetical protein